ncbi:hypothetical protein V8C35DRAFT_280468 [Trichoderma chlorosporum]
MDGAFQRTTPELGLTNTDQVSSAAAGAGYVPEKIAIKISGLRQKISAINRGFETYSCVLHIPKYTYFSELGQILGKQEPNLIIPTEFKFKGCSYPISREWIDCFTLPVRVTDGPSCYNASAGYQINKQQSIAAFFSKIFPDPLKARIRRHPRLTSSGVKLSHTVTVERDDASVLQISLARTAQISDNEIDAYSVQETSDTFPLFNTELYKDQLPLRVTSQGGLFFPMDEKETMGITFDCSRDAEYAVRPLVGEDSTPNHFNSFKRKEYIVVPEQNRMDGMSFQPDIVEHFRAMQLDPESADEEDYQLMDVDHESHETAIKREIVERQMRGKDEIQGKCIQLQIIPQFKPTEMFAGSVRDTCPRQFGGRLESYMPIPDDVVTYDVLKAPYQLGLSVGDTVHIRNLRLGRNYDRSKTLMDLKMEMPNSSDMLELEPFQTYAPELIISVQCPGSNKNAVIFIVDIRDGFEDFQKSAQKAFELPGGVLHIPGLVNNNPNLPLPVTSWKHLIFLQETAIWDEKDHWADNGCYATKLKNKRSDRDDGPLYYNTLIYKLIQGTVIIELQRELRGGFPDNVITVTYGATKLVFEAFSNIGSLKAKLFRRFGIFVHRQCLGLPDDFSLQSKSANLELRMQPHEPLSSGIYAGGTLMQGLTPDKSDPSLWDVGNSKFLTIHVMNPNDFRNVTGLHPPRSPLPWMVYSRPSYWEKMLADRESGDDKGEYKRPTGLKEEEEEEEEEEDHKMAFGKSVQLEELENYSKDDWGLTLSDKYNTSWFGVVPLVLLEVDYLAP